ncbi:FprA family A-type flavoprotein [Scatolibacter rhodanostii]|uniref:FprA family A-type flavoprotein n=1 Tax=Scatolibacter rhodanostii TaxID=2014781 RepID=UPI001FA921AC|nr:FprA family A-type flavoprotein [Scatolibacter rhodanostii]
MKQLREKIWWNGVFDRELKVFDIIMETKYGTTYNAYTIVGSEKTALIETAKEVFVEDYIREVQELVGANKVDYIIVNHTEPDHSGSIARLLDLNPEIEIIGTTAALSNLKEILNRSFKSRVAKEGDEISLGDKTLRFIMAPNLHWPDTMFTYIPEEKMLFTCDSFGAHYGTESVLRSEVKDEETYYDALKYYFDVILSPFIPFMRKAMAKIADLEIDMICTGHGPILDSHIGEVFARYKEWTAEPEKREKKLVVIPYVSSYGYTKQMAVIIAEAVASQGVEVRLYNLVEDDCTNLKADLLAADGILLGSPTILSDALEPIHKLCADMLPITHGGKQAAAFGSYGWTGEAVGNLTERLKQLRMKVSDGLKIRFRPSEAQIEECKEFGTSFAASVLGK